MSGIYSFVAFLILLGIGAYFSEIKPHETVGRYFTLASIIPFALTVYFVTRVRAGEVASSTTGRHRYARASVTDEVKMKLMTRLQNDQDLELLADDIIEVMAVARNDPDGFRAASCEFDRLATFNTEKS